MAKETRGRPITVDTPETRQKIEEATALDASIEEVCFYADISRESYYQLIKKDKDFSDRLDALRNRPILKARQTVIARIGESYANAMDYLKRKKKLEFGENVDITTNGKTLPTPILNLNEIRSDNNTKENSEIIKED